MRALLQPGEKSFSAINLSLHDLPAVISMPHSGWKLPAEMAAALRPDVTLPNMDWYVPRLYDFLGSLGFTVIINQVSRYAADPNRPPKFHDGGSYLNNPVYTSTTQDEPMYAEEPDRAELERRMDQYYFPYHQALEDALNAKLRRHRKALLIDLHAFGLDKGADIVLGNRHGLASSPGTFQVLSRQLRSQNFRVSHNIPYAGGYVTRRFGLEFDRVEALQAELWYQAFIDRRPFGNEEFPAINENLFQNTQKRLKAAFTGYRDWLREEFR